MMDLILRSLCKGSYYFGSVFSATNFWEFPCHWIASSLSCQQPPIPKQGPGRPELSTIWALFCDLGAVCAPLSLSLSLSLCVSFLSRHVYIHI